MIEKDILRRLQAHTIEIYHLEECIGYELETISARLLLNPSRFDLFAKLFYIEQREIGHIEEGLKVYLEHIKAFNPDLKEPGREDKNSLDDFVQAFNRIIDQFRDEGFDSSVSLVPVSEDGVILDGAHRVSALAFFNRDVAVVRFAGVSPKCKFDYAYFIGRGLSWTVSDTIAHHMMGWMEDLHVACIWPRAEDEIGSNYAISYLKSRYAILYEKTVRTSLKSLMSFILAIYSNQEWTNDRKAVEDKALSCYKTYGKLHFIFFKEHDLSLVNEEKRTIRDNYHIGKHSLHISDTAEDAELISSLVLNEDGLVSWYAPSILGRVIDKLKEKTFYFKYVELIRFKTKVYKIIFGK